MKKIEAHDVESSCDKFIDHSATRLPVREAIYQLLLDDDRIVQILNAGKI